MTYAGCSGCPIVGSVLTLRTLSNTETKHGDQNINEKVLNIWILTQIGGDRINKQMGSCKNESKLC